MGKMNITSSTEWSSHPPHFKIYFLLRQQTLSVNFSKVSPTVKTVSPSVTQEKKSVLTFLSNSFQWAQNELRDAMATSVAVWKRYSLIPNNVHFTLYAGCSVGTHAKLASHLNFAAKTQLFEQWMELTLHSSDQNQLCIPEHFWPNKKVISDHSSPCFDQPGDNCVKPAFSAQLSVQIFKHQFCLFV